MYRKITFDRDELYKEAWEAPMTEVAKRYGLSDTGLAKICRRLLVPLPGRGYWRRKAAGFKDLVPKLSPLPPGRPTTQVLEIDSLDEIEDGEEAKRLMAREEDPAFRVEVPEELSRPHAFVKQASPILRRCASAAPRAAQYEAACLDIRVSRGTLPRALRIADSLLKALEARGFQVEVTEPVKNPSSGWYYRARGGQPSQTFVTILGSRMKIYLEEIYLVTKVEPKAPSAGLASFLQPRAEYKHTPTGKITLKIDEYGGRKARRSWSDGKEQNIEKCLNKIIICLIKVAERQRIIRQENERWKQERQEEARKKQEALEARKLEERKIADLNDRLASWQQARQLDEFLAVLEKGRQQAGARADDSEAERWLEWAHRHVREIERWALEDLGDLPAED